MQLVDNIRWEHARVGEGQGDADEGADAVGAVDLERRRAAVAATRDQAEQARKAEGVVAVRMRDEDLVNLARPNGAAL